MSKRIMSCDMAEKGGKDFYCETIAEYKDGVFTIIKQTIFDVLERSYSNRCPKDSVITIGGKFCTTMCSKFEGHQSYGESVRCSNRLKGR